MVSSPVNGILNSDKKQLPHGYPVNTTIELKCLFGFEIKGNRFLKCTEIFKEVEDNFVYEAKWSLDEIGSCDPFKNQIENEKMCVIDSIEVEILNKTEKKYVNNGNIILYSCKSNPLVQYEAKCINGKFLMQIDCDDKSNCIKSKFSFLPSFF